MIRKASKKDVGAISLLLNEINEQHILLAPSRYKKVTDDFNHSYIKKYLSEESNTVIVSEINNRIIGVALLSIKNYDHNGPTKNIKTAFLDTIAVSSSQRRRGVGQELLTEIEKLAKQLSCSAIKINVAAENNDALKFYEQLDYKESDIQLIKII
ncbi:MAG: GNAT family N-acetyltransferase [Candidatus Atribacteria bacterium]|nr:GNAT family N-acetyltransferase [Candidatus Atribacteria bacterium]